MRSIAKMIPVSLLVCGLLLALGGCGKEKTPDTFVAKAALTDQEKKIVALLDGKPDCIFDYQADKAIKTIRVNLYKLDERGEWGLVSSLSELETAEKGRIALKFANLASGVRIGVHGQQKDEKKEEKIYSIEIPPGQIRTADLSWVSVSLSDPVALEYDKEIPLVVEVFSSKSGPISASLNYFNEPGRFAEKGYDHVYALTVQFSKDL